MNSDNPHMPRMYSTMKRFKAPSVIAVPSLGARAYSSSSSLHGCCRPHTGKEVSPRHAWHAALRQGNDDQFHSKVGDLVFPEDSGRGEHGKGRSWLPASSISHCRARTQYVESALGRYCLNTGKLPERRVPLFPWITHPRFSHHKSFLLRSDLRHLDYKLPVCHDPSTAAGKITGCVMHQLWDGKECFFF